MTTDSEVKVNTPQQEELTKSQESYLSKVGKKTEVVEPKTVVPDSKEEDKTNVEKSTIEKPDSFTQDDWDKMNEEWKEKFVKQSSSTTKTLQETYDRVHKVETAYVTKNPERLIELYESEDPKDNKLGQRISKELFGLTLEEAVKEAKEAAGIEEDDSKKEARLKREIERDLILKQTQKSFLKDNQVLDSSSSEYDETIANTFKAKMAVFKSNEITTPEDLLEISNDAFLLATKNLSSEQRNKLFKKAEKSLASAGNASPGKGGDEFKKKNPFAGLTRTN